jgi:outer membrane protein assembly factor BamB
MRSTHRAAGWLALAGFAGGFLSVAQAADWPQWRGPQRNGISTETGWKTNWSGGRPRQVWSAQIGEGYSGVAVSAGKAYTLGHAGGKDTVFCLNAATGKVLWFYSYPCSTGDYSGPRATPIVDGGKVYTLSREAQAFCFDAASGKVIWANDMRRTAGAQTPTWGFAGSPLIEGDKVIYNVNQAGVALSKASGKILWRSAPSTPGYASPVAYNLGKERLAVIFAAKGAVGVRVSDGRQVWSYPWETSYDVNAADPIFAGSDVFLSSNYGKGCVLIHTHTPRPQVIWQNRSMKNHFNASVLYNGAFYGNDENTLRCLDLRTGAERWSVRGMDKGGLIIADGKIIALTGRGELVVAQATPARYNELARVKILDGECWTQPTLANGLLYCRNHEGKLVCLDLR